MQNRRDQVQAHRFVMGRLSSGLLRGEPDSQFTPLRRFVVGTIAGVVLGVLVMAGFGVVGLFFPGGSKAWRQPKALIVEKETGARYVYVDGELRPVLNYTSARLILNGEPKVVRVSRKSLRGVPHGLPIGIESAPDYLPDMKRLDGWNWQVCSALRADVSGVGRPWVTLWVGAKPVGRSLGTDRALLVRTPKNQIYLAWNNRRWRVPDTATLGALGYSAAPQHLVGWAWINALPAGPDLRAPEVPGLGQAGPLIDGRPTAVGQVFKVSGTAAGASQYYLVRADGLAPLTMTGAALLVGDPRTREAYPEGPVEALPLPPGALATAPQSRSTAINPQLPAKAPEPAEVGRGELPCLQLGMDAANGVTVQVAVGTKPAATGAAPGVAAAMGDPRLAHQVVVEPGAGLLVRDQPAPGVTDGALYLLVDCGLRYPLPGPEAVRMLGYAEAKAVPVPGPLLALIPAGRPLDPRAALATAPVTERSAAGATAADPPAQPSVPAT